jgi:RHS repeat-associated protein
MLLELDGLNGDSVVRKYAWGLDVSGQSRDREGADMLESAGSIGGLVAIEQVAGSNAGSYACFYDGNGNLGQLVDIATGAVAAKYEYDPYGNNLLDPANATESGPYAAENPIRFSTKYWDGESGFGYWGYRYYSARLGRWLGRDPIGERGGSSPGSRWRPGRRRSVCPSPPGSGCWS